MPVTTAYLENLNSEQRRAVEHGVSELDCTSGGPLLVIDCRCRFRQDQHLAYRVAHLISSRSTGGSGRRGGCAGRSVSRGAASMRGCETAKTLPEDLTYMPHPSNATHKAAFQVLDSADPFAALLQLVSARVTPRSYV